MTKLIDNFTEVYFIQNKHMSKFDNQNQDCAKHTENIVAT